jgi:hypothetical protein
MRILTIIALAAMTFGFVSCAHKPAPAPSGDGKTMHGHGYKK